jgi:hypothetical protein
VRHLTVLPLKPGSCGRSPPQGRRFRASALVYGRKITMYILIVCIHVHRLLLCVIDAWALLLGLYGTYFYKVHPSCTTLYVHRNVSKSNGASSHILPTVRWLSRGGRGLSVTPAARGYSTVMNPLKSTGASSRILTAHRRSRTSQANIVAYLTGAAAGASSRVLHHIIGASSHIPHPNGACTMHWGRHYRYPQGQVRNNT